MNDRLTTESIQEGTSRLRCYVSPKGRFMWCNKNQMTLNVSKSKLMLISSKHSHRQIHLYTIVTQTIFVAVLALSLLLGVHINSAQTWDEHVNKLIRNATHICTICNGIYAFNQYRDEICSIIHILPHLLCYLWKLKYLSSRQTSKTSKKCCKVNLKLRYL